MKRIPKLDKLWLELLALTFLAEVILVTLFYHLIPCLILWYLILVVPCIYMYFKRKSQDGKLWAIYVFSLIGLVFCAISLAVLYDILIKMGAIPNPWFGLF